MKRAMLLPILLFVLGCSQKSTEDWLKQLKDDDVVLRREAIRELGDSPRETERIVPALTEMLRDKNPYVRHDAALTLGKFGPDARAAVPAIKALLKDKDQSVRHGITAALKKISGPTSPPARSG